MAHDDVTKSRLEIDGITLDIENGRVTGPDGTHRLTPIECRLLRVLMLHPGQVVSRAFLMKVVWRTDYLADTRTLDVHICWLRKKIEPDSRLPQYLKTVRGVGYRFGLG